MSLPTRTLGPLSVSAMGLGSMNLSQGYNPLPTREDAQSLLRAALESGITFFDTAAIYGDGHNEALIGETLSPHRQEFILASKCVLGQFDGKRGVDGRPSVIHTTLDAALGRLKTDHIDLYYLHRLDPDVPIEESVGALGEAMDAGKIGAIGVSEMSADTIRHGHAERPITAVQSEYSPMARNVEIAVLETCRELGIGFVAFSPVGRGLLSNAVRDEVFTGDDIRVSLPRYRQPDLGHNLKAVDRFNALAAELGITPAQLSLAWALAQGDDIVPIPGTRRVEHLAENLDALSITLEPVVLETITDIFSGDAIRGARYGRSMQAMVGTELFEGETLA